MTKVYDMIIIGGGPAGYTAALYAARAGMEVVVLEKMFAGGQMTETMKIENYPGFKEIAGFDLGMKMQEGAERFGVETQFTEVLKADLVPEIKIIETTTGEYRGKTIVIAMGAGHKTLGVEHEAELTGRGVAYCATCDGMFYRGKEVAIVGGGNTAVADALHLANIVDKVTLIHRRDTLKATKIYHDPLMQAENIDIMWNSQIDELVFGDKLSGVKVKNLETGQITELPVEGLFVSVGRTPATKLFEGQLELDEQGYIVADESTRTSIPGVYAVGDIRTKALRQVITAASDGAVATHYAEEYLMK